MIHALCEKPAIVLPLEIDHHWWLAVIVREDKGVYVYDERENTTRDDRFQAEPKALGFVHNRQGEGWTIDQGSRSIATVLLSPSFVSANH
jgi:hypothetical protein